MNSSIFCFLQKSVILDTVKTADFSHLLLHSGISTLLRKGGWKDKERLVLSQTWFWPQGLPARISDIPGGPQSMLWERQLLTKESQTPWGAGWAGGGGGDMQDGHQHVLALFNSHHTCPQDPRPPTGKGALEKNPAVILEAIHFVLLKLF